MMKDVYQNVTDRVIEALERGVNPWRKPWNENVAAPTSGMPHNAINGRPYRGINVALLMIEAMEKGYQSTGWITPKRAIEHRLNFKGQKTTEVIFWKQVQKRAEADDEEPGKFLVARTYRVLNLDQCEGDKSKLKGTGTVADLSDLSEPKLAKEIAGALDLTIKHGGNRACYIPSIDQIHMPPRKAFKLEHGYTGTLLHEATHATGAEHRLNREFGERFGDERYAAEELVAELGATYLQALLNLDGELENHVSYVDNWLRVLRGDKRAVFTAASMAQKAADFILDAMGVEVDQWSEEAEAA